MYERNKTTIFTVVDHQYETRHKICWILFLFLSYNLALMLEIFFYLEHLLYTHLLLEIKLTEIGGVTLHKKLRTSYQSRMGRKKYFSSPLLLLNRHEINMFQEVFIVYHINYTFAHVYQKPCQFISLSPQHYLFSVLPQFSSELSMISSQNRKRQ